MISQEFFIGAVDQFLVYTAYAIEVIVMEYNEFVIARELYIQFASHVIPCGLLESRDGIFGDIDVIEKASVSQIDFLKRFHFRFAGIVVGLDEEEIDDDKDEYDLHTSIV